jgi:hypothetical protein
MSTVRAFFNNERIATGRNSKDGRFFQAYPFKQYFDNKTIWREHVIKTIKEKEVVFVDEDKPVDKPVEKEKPVEQMSYQYSENTIVTLPAGRYYIGDVCYALKDILYDTVFGSNGYANGHYALNDGVFVVNSTAYGDGSYEGTNGYEYGVDAGIIGIASMGVCVPENKVYGGTLHTFTEPVKCSFKNGMFEFSSGNWHLEIDTAHEGDDDRSDC